MDTSTNKSRKTGRNSESRGLKIDIFKTKVLRLNAKRQDPIKINGIDVEDTYCFVYLRLNAKRQDPIKINGIDVEDTYCFVYLRLNAKRQDPIKINGIDVEDAYCFVYLRLNAKRQDPIKINGIDVEDTYCFVYLGTIVNNLGGVEQDIQSRSGKARSALNHL